MPTPGLRSILAAAALLIIGDVVFAQSTPAPAISEDRRMLPYAKPGQLIDIGGRRINLQCVGTGGPTVVLMAGLYSWSLVWYKVQSEIAQKARVCAFDRAAYGFSDPPSWPQIISGVVEDLHAALKAGAIPGPYVLVGHSFLACTHIYTTAPTTTVLEQFPLSSCLSSTLGISPAPQGSALPDLTARSGTLCIKPWRGFPRAACTGSSKDQVTRFR
jgi:hypothetical protein